MTDQEKSNFIFETLKKSGVAISQLASLTGISRNTLHTWKKGADGFDKMRLRMAYNVVLRLDKAADQKRLPLPDGTPAKEKLTVLTAVIKSTAL